MSSFDQVINELLSIDADVMDISAKAQRENGEITKTMNKVQRSFGDQGTGQSLVNTLYKTMQSMIIVDGALHQFREEIRNSIQTMKK